MNLIESVRIFKRVAESGSFSVAAKEAHLGQPTVSKAVKSLEQHLGVSLLNRTTRGLSLTPEGRKLLFTGGALLDQAELMIASVRSEKLQLQGPLRITASVAFSRIVLAPMLQEFLNQQPGLRLHFQLSDGFLDLVESNVDVAIRLGKLEDNRLRALRIGTSNRALYASKNYVKTFGKPASLEDLSSHRLLSYTRLGNRPSWPLVAKDGSSRPFYFEPYFQSDGSDLMREACIRGIGIGLLPTWMMIDEEKSGDIVRILPKQTATQIPIFAVTGPGRSLSVRQRVFIDFLKSQLDQKPHLSVRN
jgi:DNA-binding transcriptional LysR family regulator